MRCEIHKDFFDDSCELCRSEYLEMKGGSDGLEGDGSGRKKYKELTEERAKKLYEELMLQYLKSGVSEVEADGKAKAIIRKQCAMRGMPVWAWV